MIDEKEVIIFFDRLASSWDEEIVKDADKIGRIVDAAEIKEGSRILDVACGTGVLIPDYLARNVARVVAFDISPNMIATARSKFEDQTKVEFQCTDVAGLVLKEEVDSVMIYNAFPHFAKPKEMIAQLAQKVRIGGRLTVAHDMGIEQLNAHHELRAMHVSVGLITTEEMAKLFEPYFEVTYEVSEEDIYIVSGVRK